MQFSIVKDGTPIFNHGAPDGLIARERQKIERERERKRERKIERVNLKNASEHPAIRVRAEIL